MNTPAPMSHEQIIKIAQQSPINETYWLAPKADNYADEVAEITAFCQAIIAARDKQWSEMLGEPVGYIYSERHYRTPDMTEWDISYHGAINVKTLINGTPLYVMHKNIEEIDTSEKRV